VRSASRDDEKLQGFGEYVLKKMRGAAEHAEASDYPAVSGGRY